MKKYLFALLIIQSSVLAQVRTSLIEEFTGEDCPPCATYNPAFDSTLALYPSKIIPIKWQVPIPSAPSFVGSLYKTNEAEILWRYRSAANGGYGYNSQNTPTNNITQGVLNAPSVRIDGTHQWNFGGTSDHPYYTDGNIINAAQSQTTNFSISMNTAWDGNFDNCAVTVSVTSSTPLSATGTLYFHLCLVERVINFSFPPGSNGETHFENAVRRSYPTTSTGTVVNTMGTILPGTWTANQTHTFVVNCAAPSYIMDKGQMAFVGFVQDNATKHVYQAARTSQPLITNIASVKKENISGFDVYPNPANAKASILLNTQNTDDVKVSVINNIGQLVYNKKHKTNIGANELSLDCKNFAPGIYNIVLDSEKNTSTKKLIISK